jgi:hypothetical protein
LIQSEIKNERFTLLEVHFRDILNAKADGLGVKAYTMQSPFMETGDYWFVSNVFQKKIDQNISQSLYSNTLYSNEKLKDINNDFINVHYNNIPLEYTVVAPFNRFFFFCFLIV